MPRRIPMIDLSGENAARRAFEALAGHPDRAIDLATGALLIAAEEMEDRTVELSLYLRELDLYASRTRQRVAPGAGVTELLVSLHQTLFEEAGYAGQADEEHTPSCALLPEVMERRRGLPILLSLIYVEVARRCGLEASGVCFPGHFLSRIELDDGFVIVDAFHRGRFLDRDDCEALLAEVSGGTIGFDLDLLEPAPPRQVLTRILSNLREIYLRCGDDARALRAQERVVLLNPSEPRYLRERARLYQKIGAPQAAVRDLERVLKLLPFGFEAEAVRHELEGARTATRHLN